MTFANNSFNPIFADRAYTYKVTSPPGVTPISVAEVKSFAKITTSSDDALIAIMINAAVEYAENFTRRGVITRIYETFRDLFPGHYQGYGHSVSQVSPLGGGQNFGFEIRKSPLQTIDEVKYLDTAGATIVVPTTVYYNTVEDDYSTLLSLPGQSWPTDEAEQLQAITITLKTGFGDAATDVPDDIRNALLMHVTSLYENRGDCESGSCGSIPSLAKRIYLQNRIHNL